MVIARTDEFIAALKPLTTESEIKALCESELEYLRASLEISYQYGDNGLPIAVNGSVTGLHNQLTKYRNAVKAQIELTPQNSYRFVKGRKYVEQHYALKYLVKSEIERLERGEMKTTQVYQDQTNLRPIDPDELILKAESLLESNSYTALAIGIMLLTGRRSIEVLKTARFEVVSDYEVSFTGQAKTKGSDNAVQGSYTIPVLTSSESIVSALKRLRELKDFSDLTNQQVHSRVNKSLSEQVKRHFSDLIPSAKVKDLRAAYATVCADFYKPDTMTDTAYFAKILGHSAEDITTAQSYQDFYIA